MDETPASVAYQLGRLEAQNTAQDGRLAGMESTLKDISAKLDSVGGYIERQRGARKVTAALASMCGALAGVAVTWWTGR